MFEIEAERRGARMSLIETLLVMLPLRLRQGLPPFASIDSTALAVVVVVVVATVTITEASASSLDF